MAEVTMPRLSDTMTEGTLARWVKHQGDQVEKGDVLAEIETDKATMELEAYEAGMLEQVLVEEGQTVPIGEPIARIGAPSGSAPRPRREPPPQAASKESVGEPPREAVPKEREDQPPRPPSPEGRRRDGEEERQEEDEDQVRASPMARRIARERGIDLHSIKGSGPGGRIIRADVEASKARTDGGAVVAPRAAPPMPEPAQPPPVAVSGAPEQEVEEVPLSNIRRVTGRRLVESVQSAPHFFLTTVVDVTRLLALRAEINQELAAAGDETKVTLTDLVVKACGVALRSSPDVNVSFGGDKLLRKKRIHVGIAVAVANGLIVPVLRDADQKSVGQIASETKALVERARAGKLTPAEYSGGTFTVSNLGMFGIEHFTAVINLPEAAILAVGASAAEPVAVDGKVEVRERMRLTLSVDHRALDGATGARFLQLLKSVLEAPVRMLV